MRITPSALCMALATLASTSWPAFAQAPDIEAGRARAATVCAACHGSNGVSIADAIPNLAGQRAAYLESQLRAFKSGTRKAASMNAIAAQLSATDIGQVAAYFASLATPQQAARSTQLPHLASTRVTFPEGYKDRGGFRMYQTVNRPDINQVRYLWANAAAWQAARAGEPLPHGSVLLLEQHAARLDGDKKPVTGADGFFVSDRLVAYALMANGAGWGKDFPDMLANGDWNYAVFNPDGQIRAGVNQADCLACHKPLDKANYLFSDDVLKKAARR